MKINEKLGAIAMMLTLILVITNAVQAAGTRDMLEQNAIWNTIKKVDLDIAESNDKVDILREKVGLVENHIKVKTKLRSDLKSQLEDISNGGSIQLSENEPLPYKIGGTAQQNQYVHYAWRISKDADFVYLLEAENGKWDPLRISNIPGANGYRDVGFCQVNIGYHPNVYYDERFKTDWKWQMDKCYELYKGGTKFYGMGNIWKTKNHFEWR